MVSGVDGMKMAITAYSVAVVVPDSDVICGAIAAPTRPNPPVMTASRRSAKRRNASRVVVLAAVTSVMELPFGWMGGDGRCGPHAATSFGGRPRTGSRGITPDGALPGITRPAERNTRPPRVARHFRHIVFEVNTT